MRVPYSVFKRGTDKRGQGICDELERETHVPGTGANLS